MAHLPRIFVPGFPLQGEEFVKEWRSGHSMLLHFLLNASLGSPTTHTLKNTGVFSYPLMSSSFRQQILAVRHLCN